MAKIRISFERSDLETNGEGVGSKFFNFSYNKFSNAMFGAVRKTCKAWRVENSANKFVLEDEGTLEEVKGFKIKIERFVNSNEEQLRKHPEFSALINDRFFKAVRMKVRGWALRKRGDVLKKLDGTPLESAESLFRTMGIFTECRIYNDDGLSLIHI